MTYWTCSTSRSRQPQNVVYETDLKAATAVLVQEEALLMNIKTFVLLTDKNDFWKEPWLLKEWEKPLAASKTWWRRAQRFEYCVKEPKLVRENIERRAYLKHEKNIVYINALCWRDGTISCWGFINGMWNCLQPGSPKTLSVQIFSKPTAL